MEEDCLRARNNAKETSAKILTTGARWLPAANWYSRQPRCAPNEWRVGPRLFVRTQGHQHQEGGQATGSSSTVCSFSLALFWIISEPRTMACVDGSCNSQMTEISLSGGGSISCSRIACRGTPVATAVTQRCHTQRLPGASRKSPPVCIHPPLMPQPSHHESAATR